MTVTVASLTDIEQVVERLLDAHRPLVVDRGGAARLLGISYRQFGRLLEQGLVEPVPHLSPPRYAVRALEQFVSPGPVGAGPLSGGSVSPLPRPRAADRGTDPTARGGPTTPAA